MPLCFTDHLASAPCISLAFCSTVKNIGKTGMDDGTHSKLKKGFAGGYRGLLQDELSA